MGIEVDNRLNAYCVRDEIRSGILLDTPEEVATAILAYGGEITEHALRENIHQMSVEGSGLNALFFQMQERKADRKSFASRVADAALFACQNHREKNHDDLYRGSWDYDGPGPFHKCSLGVTRVLDKNGHPKFRLSISAAYVGNKGELELARMIGKSPGLNFITFERGWKSPGKRFAIPIAEITALWPALGQFPPSHEELLSQLTTVVKTDEWTKDIKDFRVYGDGQVSVFLGFDCHTIDFKPWKGESSNLFSIEGGNIMGPARESVRTVEKKVRVKNPAYRKRRGGFDYEMDIHVDPWMTKRVSMPREPQYFEQTVHEEQLLGHESPEIAVTVYPTKPWGRFDAEIHSAMMRMASRIESIWPRFGKHRWAQE